VADLQKTSLKRTEQLWFPPEDLHINPDNGRDLTTPDNVEHIEDIARKIADKGFLESHPLEFFIKDGVKYISDGNVRRVAVGLCIERGTASFPKGIPCVREPKGTSEVDRILNQDAHNSGKRFNALEHGRNIKRALAMGLTVAEVAQRLGKSTSHVEQAIAFQAAPVEVHAMVKAGKVSATLAAKVVRKEGGTKGAATLKAAEEAAHARGKSKATERDIPAGPTVTIEINVVGELKGALRTLLEACGLPEGNYAVVKGRHALARAEG
jgi:hypothetical protein